MKGIEGNEFPKSNKSIIKTRGKILFTLYGTVYSWPYFQFNEFDCFCCCPYTPNSFSSNRQLLIDIISYN